MKTAIVTVYNTANCGSFLQAYALKSAIEKLGHEVYFLYRDLKGTDNTLKSHIRYCMIKCAKLNFGAGVNFIKRYYNFKAVNKDVPVVYRNSPLFNEIDCFVIGSDTVWNLDLKYFNDNKNTYTGLDLPDVKKITYAASAANTAYEVFENDEEIKEGIKKLNSISVRDSSTKDIVERLTGISPELVCDPTLLIDEKEYASLIADDSDLSKQKYIFIYHFSDISDIKKKHILELKKQTGCQLVSFGEYRSWCDVNPAYDPKSFLAYMKDADFVITNTFHGTIFSVIFHKNFADYGGKKLKITDFLNQLELQDTIVDDNSNLVDRFNMPLDYDIADKALEKLRQQSINYLSNSLGEV